MHRTHSVRTTSYSTRKSPKERKIEDIRKASIYTMRKENTLLVTAIKRRKTIVSLKEETT
jgi:hypothetical protein